MKKTLGFSIAWTVGATVLLAFWVQQDDFHEQSTIFKFIFLMFPGLGLWFVHRSWKEHLRYRSVVEVNTANGPVFEWTDLNGSLRLDMVDPRIRWDEKDCLGGG